jgi:hypothetical protein
MKTRDERVALMNEVCEIATSQVCSFYDTGNSDSGCDPYAQGESFSSRWRVKLTFALVHGLGTQFREKGSESSGERAEISKIELHGRAIVQCAVVLSSRFLPNPNLTALPQGWFTNPGHYRLILAFRSYSWADTNPLDCIYFCKSTSIM